MSSGIAKVAVAVAQKSLKRKMGFFVQSSTFHEVVLFWLVTASRPSVPHDDDNSFKNAGRAPNGAGGKKYTDAHFSIKSFHITET